ncbi:RDD family protein [Antribacter sp. KLBMP9083]|uniref:RDD family protein n=1 Tax=Antribacter soli TaxID=2910976 RepID=A0AA41QGR9_9MICO|nr:RDD family protein [Antribacter soli]MCF4122828.1 RDD family protein [Antribacter soli]
MTDVVCAGCGSPQAAGSPYCAVCGREFPRTGRPVAEPVAGPVGQVAAAAGAAGRSAVSGPVYRHSEPNAATEPEMYTATVRPTRMTAAPEVPAAPYAGVGRRFLAWLLDGLVAGVVVGVIGFVGLQVAGVPLGVTATTSQEANDLLGRLSGVYLLSGLVGLAYAVTMWIWEGRTGRTLGNLALGIRTVDAETRGAVGFGRAFLRTLLVSLGSLACGVGQLVVLLSPLWDKGGRRQGWHDKVARAVVVDVRGAVETIPAVPATANAPGRYAPATVAPMAPPSPVGPPPATSPWATPMPGPAAPAAPAFPGTGQTSPAAPAQPDPWSFPSAQPAADGGAGIITGVPGVTSPSGPAAAQQPPVAQPLAPQAPAPQAPAPYAPAPQAPPAAFQQPDSRPTRPAQHPGEATGEQPSWDTTRMGLPTSPGVLTPAPLTTVVLELESGSRHVVDGPALIGRNPQSTDGAHAILVKIDDPTRSVSKTHAELGVDSAGLWLTDRGSTNGSVVSAPGLPPRVAEPGARVRVPVGSTIHLGDRRVLVHPQGQA